MHPRRARWGREVRLGAKRFRSLLAASVLAGLSSHEAFGAEPEEPYSPSPRAAAASAAPKTTAAHRGVDTARVHKLYIEGDFDEAIALLEANLNEAGAYRHEDSVFIFKHLGVMYAARYDTREKGKAFMHRLLQVEPEARIMDMYASDMIYMIFKNIQEEYAQNRMQLAARYPDRKGGAPADAAPGNASEAPSGSGPSQRGSGTKTWLWTGAAVAAVAAGVGAYYLIASEPKTDVHTHAVAP